MTTTVIQHEMMPLRQIETAWDMYERAFAPLEALALQRHMMTVTEFYRMACDDKITKLVAYDDDKRMVGLSTVTNDLDSWPLIAPAFVRRRWPDLYRQRRVWYVGFICVDPPAQSSDAFENLLLETSAPARVGGGGLFLMDFCTLNVRRGLPAHAERLLAPHSGQLKLKLEDAQEFWSFTFGGSLQ